MPSTPRRREASEPELRLLAQLEAKRGEWKPELDKNADYLEGEQPLSYMAVDLAEDLGEEVVKLVINWPRLVAESYAERLVAEGMRYPKHAGAVVSGDELWGWWQANQMAAQSKLGHLDAIALGKAAIIVGHGEDVPTITVESAEDVAWIRDPLGRTVVKAMKAWASQDDALGEISWRNLYVPGRLVTLRSERGRWLVDSERDHAPRVPVVPMVNNPRLKRLDGRSQYHDIVPLADAANKMATDMMVSGEYHAMPRRWAFGMKKEDFIDPTTGKFKNPWSVIKGRLWSSEDKDVKVGQFPEADLKNFHETIKLLARLTGHLAVLPTDYMSFDSVNPPSADSMRAEESRMVKKLEDKQIIFGDAYEESNRHAIWFATGSYDDDARRLETVWRDPGTPTIAQKADAVVKKVTTKGADGRPLVPTEQGRIDLGYTPEERADMAAMESEALQDPVAAAYRRLAGGMTDASASYG